MDTITNMSPLDTPLLSILGTREGSQRKFEWPVDDIPRAQDPGTEIVTIQEGKDAGEAGFAFDAVVHADRFFNMHQTNGKLVDVSRTSMKADMAGIDDPYAYQMEKQQLRLGTEVELALALGVGRDVANTTTTQATANPRVTHGILNWLAYTGLARTKHGVDATIGYGGAAGTLTVPLKYCSYVVDGATAVLARDNFFSVLQGGYRIGFPVNNSLLLTGSTLKKRLTDFAIAISGTQAVLNHRNIPAEMAKLQDSIMVIETDFGTVWLNTYRYLDPTNTALTMNYDRSLITGLGAAAFTPTLVSMFFLLQPEYFKISLFDGFHHEPLAKTGDNERGMIVGEWGALVRNPIAGIGGVNFT